MRRNFKIVSLLPASTEIVCELGLGDHLVGRSHECDFPAAVRTVPACTRPRIDPALTGAAIDQQVKERLGHGLSLYEIDTEKLRQLRPDYILTQAQCEVCAVSLQDMERIVAAELDFKPKIISTAPQRLADLWDDMSKIAEALGESARGKALIDRLKARVVDVLEKTCRLKNGPTVAAIEWLDPLMAAGNWVPELVQLAGGRNVLGQSGKHSSWLTWNELHGANPEFIVLMPCGFDLARTEKEFAAVSHSADWKKLRAWRRKKIFLTDGNQFFNRPGPRLVESLEILAEMVQPRLFHFGYEGKAWKRFGPRD